MGALGQGKGSPEQGFPCTTPAGPSKNSNQEPANHGNMHGKTVLGLLVVGIMLAAVLPTMSVGADDDGGKGKDKKDKKDSGEQSPPLPPPIHDERSVSASVGVGNPVDTACGETYSCFAYLFTLPRPAAFGVRSSWSVPTNAVVFDIRQDGNLIHNQGPAVGTSSVVFQIELPEGSFELKARMTRMFSDRYVLDAKFAELLPQDDSGGAPPRTHEEAMTAVRALLADTPCEAPYSGTRTTENLLPLSVTGFDVGGPQELDVRGDLLLAARAGGFSTVDISDPLVPRILGHYGDAGGNLDVKFSPDGQTALVSSIPRIDLVDVRNPDTLDLVGRWQLTDAPQPPQSAPNENAHMIGTAHIAGQDWVFLATQSSTGIWILRLDGTPDARTLTFVTTTPLVNGALAPHDVFIQLDPLLDRWILYTANAFDGWTAFDVTDPTSPEFLTLVPNLDVSATHSVQATTIGNRRIVVTSTEGGMNALKVWDATSLLSPTPIGQWTYTVGPEIKHEQHNINIVEGRLYQAHYGFGLFVFDLSSLPTSTLEAFNLQPVAHYGVPLEAPVGFGATSRGFWDIVVDEGVIYAGSYGGVDGQGVHAIGYGCMPAGDPRFTSKG